MSLRWLVLLPLAVGLASVGCGKSKRAAERAAMVSEDTRRVVRIRDGSPPSEARAAMGREPDAVHTEGDHVIHYYLVKGAIKGEALRLVYHKNRLIGRSVVYAEVKE